MQKLCNEIVNRAIELKCTDFYTSYNNTYAEIDFLSTGGKVRLITVMDNGVTYGFDATITEEQEDGSFFSIGKGGLVLGIEEQGKIEKLLEAMAN